jgi:hypothetical protein
MQRRGCRYDEEERILLFVIRRGCCCDGEERMLL